MYYTSAESVENWKLKFSKMYIQPINTTSFCTKNPKLSCAYIILYYINNSILQMSKMIIKEYVI